MAKRNVLLIGGVNLESAEEVFKAVGGMLGDSVPRIPDGETGSARSFWIQCQTPFFLDNPQIEMVGSTRRPWRARIAGRRSSVRA